MGCGSGKLAPDSPIIDKHIDWVKTVETGGSLPAYGNANTPSNNHYNRVNNGENKSQRRAKWKVKFDPRVNAKYDIRALIGTGTYSRVVRVEHRSTRQPYAIKMVEKKRDGKQFWEVELSILRRVRHTNIIQLLEVYDGKDRIYMIMELATGGELFDRIVTRGNFTERDATRVLHMVLDAMRYLHGLGITHRDLKPENLLYYHPGNDSKIMITDFGLASFRKNAEGLPENNMMRTICGTPEYISPEILLRKPYTQSVDLWAIGVVAYILLSGRMPFDDDNRTRLYRKILRAKYSFTGDPWKDVSPAGKDFIDKLLVINPSERMTAAQALNHPWIVTMAAQSSLKNLQRSISQNWLKHTSTRSRSARSTRSNHSKKSSKSLQSNRGQRVKSKDLNRLAKEIKKENKTSDGKSGKSTPERTAKPQGPKPLPAIKHQQLSSSSTRNEQSSSNIGHSHAGSHNGHSVDSHTHGPSTSRNEPPPGSSRSDHSVVRPKTDLSIVLPRNEQSSHVTPRSDRSSLTPTEDHPLSIDHHLTRPSVLPPLKLQKTSSSSVPR